jgi:hypothetical protein
MLGFGNLEKRGDESLQRITCDSSKMAVEQVKGLASQVSNISAGLLCHLNAVYVQFQGKRLTMCV